MMDDKLENYRKYREKMNERILSADNKIIKRLFSLDTITYQDGALDSRTKEMLGLATSMVLRCDDCVKYHLEQCFKHGLNTDEIMEIIAVAQVVGGTIVIPHARRAVEFWDLLTQN
jgi:AhpD family alkylhydroperoxidase